jgi:thiamine biosynthesis protein ThiI
MGSGDQGWLSESDRARRAGALLSSGGATTDPDAFMNSIVVHYQEIGLKGKNRSWFTGKLVRNLRSATSDLDVKSVRALMGRIELVLGQTATREQVGERIRRLFGIANFSYAGRTALDLDTLTSAILRDLTNRTCGSFRVSARRADKRFPMTSPQIEREVGGRIQEARGWKVDLENADLVVRVELLTDQAFYFFGKEAGAGGLPTGTAGRVACLLSGGIDSPVAAHRMMKRGCAVTFIHFHSYPILSRASQEKARELATLLTKWQLRSRLFLVAFGDIQQQVVLSVPGPTRIIVYRRLMMRIAEQIALARGAQALVTGDVVGQVASQTLENLAVIGSVVTLPVFRPLIGMDKQEITAEAIALGSYPISIIPDQDCCTLFTPRNPMTRGRRQQIEAAEAALPIEALVERAVAEAVMEEFAFPVVGLRTEVLSGSSDRD